MSGSILLILRVLLTLALYSFLGWALYTLWRDMQIQRDDALTRFSPLLSLQYENGSEKVVSAFEKPEITLGRDLVCDCVLEDATVSARHTRLSFMHGQWWVEDLRSTNGTFLNQEPVTTSVVLASGDELRCGQVTLRLTIG